DPALPPGQISKVVLASFPRLSPGFSAPFSYFMMLLSPLKRLIAALFLPLLALTVYAQTAGFDASQGLQMEFPARGQLRIENDLGKVTAESWSEKYVSVS